MDLLHTLFKIDYKLMLSIFSQCMLKHYMAINKSVKEIVVYSLNIKWNLNIYLETQRSVWVYQKWILHGKTSQEHNNLLAFLV